MGTVYTDASTSISISSPADPDVEDLFKWYGNGDVEREIPIPPTRSVC